jgi:hypothetical protein
LLFVTKIRATGSVLAVAIDGGIDRVFGFCLSGAGLAFAQALLLDGGVADDLADRLLDGALGLTGSTGVLSLVMLLRP